MRCFSEWIFIRNLVDFCLVDGIILDKILPKTNDGGCIMTEVTRDFTHNLPKAELHVHIEGTLELELKLKLAQKNNIDIGQKTIAEVEENLKYDDLASFLAVYYPAMEVLVHEEDFYELAMAYLKKAAKNNVRHAEIFLIPKRILVVASNLKQSSMVYIAQL